MKKLFAWLLLCCLLQVSAVQAAEKDLNLIFIPKSSDQNFWPLMRSGVEKAMQEDGHIKLTWRGPAHNDDTDAQIKILEAYSRPGVDAILIAPTDRARLVEPVGKAVALGIKVVSIDSALDGSFHGNFVTSNNYASGQLAAKTMAELLHKKGRMLVLRTVAGSASTDDRAEGFLAYLKANAPQMSVLSDVYGGGSAGKVRHAANALLAAKPQFEGVFAVNESATDGMLRALREAGLAGKVKFIGFDASDFLLEALEKQEINGLLIQDPYQMGYLGVKAAAAAARNAPMKDRILFTETTLVNRENYRHADIRKMMCGLC